MRRVVAKLAQQRRRHREIGRDAVAIDVLIAIHTNPERVPACEHRGARWRAGLERVEGVETDAAPRQSVEAWCDEVRVDVPEVIVPEVVGHNVHQVDAASRAPSALVCGHYAKLSALTWRTEKHMTKENE
eukprot:scaffold30769_cov71-Phaeocystis_antarctica.AAC.13